MSPEKLINQFNLTDEEIELINQPIKKVGLKGYELLMRKHQELSRKNSKFKNK